MAGSVALQAGGSIPPLQLLLPVVTTPGIAAFWRI